MGEFANVFIYCVCVPINFAFFVLINSTTAEVLHRELQLNPPSHTQLLTVQHTTKMLTIYLPWAIIFYEQQYTKQGNRKTITVSHLSHLHQFVIYYSSVNRQRLKYSTLRSWYKRHLTKTKGSLVQKRHRLVLRWWY